MQIQDILEENIFGVVVLKIGNNKQTTKKNNMNITWKYASPISIEEIDAVSKSEGVTLPEVLKSMIVEGNNGEPSKKHFDSVICKDHVFKTLLSYNVKDGETVFNAIKVLKEAGANLYPFGNDPAGNLICMKGEQVVLWNHETGAEELVAHNVETFFNSLY